ncbi:aspartic proteinase CDR1-like [Papaver somniferum]|uniref:aspartic proteinase CDR1-like n=1 Tax=Papaver somniferum TaxID=3469 RepID=UPI000E7017C0|nr:aspartic proteinase CDR1-like [Papaver somniferum]
MIHIDSKESPLYPGDSLTRDERLQRIVKQSKAQARYIESQILLQINLTRSMNLDVIHFTVVYELTRFYVAMVGSGSDQTWLQCEGAIKAFTQDKPLYPWRSSTTYHPIPCNTHPLCKGDKCNANGQCTYLSRYASGSFTSYLSSDKIAEEKFTLGSDTGGPESIELLMGCGFIQENFEFIGNNHLRGKLDLIVEILGLGSGQWSFLNQLGVVGQGKFYYCFEMFNSKIEGSNTYLRFGADATIGNVGQKVHTTPIFVPGFQTQLYYLNLEDSSVGKKRVGFSRGTFKINSQGKGGTIIDSGTPVSMMYKDHFDKVADLVKEHFNDLGIEYVGSIQSFDVCFHLRGKFDVNNYPSITLHFQQADYVIQDYKAKFLMATIKIVFLGIFRENNTSLPNFTL